MTVIPFLLNSREYSVFVALNDDNIERIRAYDPAALDMSKLPQEWRGRTLREVLIGYATPADFERVMELVQQNGGDAREALRHLSRGFVFRPEDGDHDGPYLSVRPGGTKH